MANPFGEKNIGPWEGQQVEYIPLDDLVLWTENPRDPLDGDYTNDDVIRRATDGRNDKQWQLSKLSKEMGDRFDLSELPTVCRIDDGPKYRVYDGNRRVILAMLRKAGPGTFAPSRMIIRNARAFLSRVSAVSRIVPCVSPSPRGTINITYYLDEDRDISVEVGDDELASSTNLDRDDLFLVWNRDDAIPRQLLEALAQGRPLTRSWNSPSRGWSVR